MGRLSSRLFHILTAVAFFISTALLFADSLDFQPGVSYAAGTSPVGIGTGDFNRDGKPDIVVANSGSANVGVYNGNGTGGFAAATTYAVGTNPVSCPFCCPASQGASNDHCQKADACCRIGVRGHSPDSFYRRVSGGERRTHACLAATGGTTCDGG